MPKRIFWKQTVLELGKVADWLTVHNFQENKFKICYMPNDMVLLVYVEKEVANVE